MKDAVYDEQTKNTEQQDHPIECQVILTLQFQNNVCEITPFICQCKLYDVCDTVRLFAAQVHDNFIICRYCITGDLILLQESVQLLIQLLTFIESQI